MVAGGMIFDRCPMAWAQDDGKDYLDTVSDVELFTSYGTLPDDGGGLDQSPRWVETLDVVSAHLRVLREAVKD